VEDDFSKKKYKGQLSEGPDEAGEVSAGIIKKQAESRGGCIQRLTW
jgi:hypothetical protein